MPNMTLLFMKWEKFIKFHEDITLIVIKTLLPAILCYDNIEITQCYWTF